MRPGGRPDAACRSFSHPSVWGLWRAQTVDVWWREIAEMFARLPIRWASEATYASVPLSDGVVPGSLFRRHKADGGVAGLM